MSASKCKAQLNFSFIAFSQEHSDHLLHNRRHSSGVLLHPRRVCNMFDASRDVRNNGEKEMGEAWRAVGTLRFSLKCRNSPTHADKMAPDLYYRYAHLNVNNMFVRGQEAGRTPKEPPLVQSGRPSQLDGIILQAHVMSG